VSTSGAGLLIVFAGLPGTGKSTLARALADRIGATWLRVDTIEQALRDCSLALERVDDAGYAAGMALAEDNLRLGHTVIADSVNPWELTREAWRRVAERAGCPALDVEVMCSDPAEHRRRVEQRRTDVSGLALPDWQAVLDRDYHPWTSERIVIDTVGRPVEASVAELMARLPAKSSGDT